MLIDYTYFFGDLSLGQISEQSVQDKITWFISQYEPQILEGLLGYQTYKDFTSGLAVVAPATIDPKWSNLKDGAEYTDGYGKLRKWKGIINSNGTYKESLIANYIYWKYQASQATNTTGTGESKVANQNATPANATFKMVAAWNNMVTMNEELYNFMFANQADYPGWLEEASQKYFPRWDFGGFRKNTANKFLRRINVLGL